MYIILLPWLKQLFLLDILKGSTTSKRYHINFCLILIRWLIIIKQIIICPTNITKLNGRK